MESSNLILSNTSLIVLLVLLGVLIFGVLLACLARRHASKATSTTYDRRPRMYRDRTTIKELDTILNSLYFDRRHTNFEEEYRLLPISNKAISITEVNGEKITTIDDSTIDIRTENSNNNCLTQEINSYCSLSIALDFTDLDLFEIIGQGRFGPIKRGYVGRKTECIVHCTKVPYAMNSEESKVFLEHLDSSIKARCHPNVMSFIGVCGQKEDLYVVMKLENGQNLRHLLRESRAIKSFDGLSQLQSKISVISSQRLLSIMLGVARGMNYLDDNSVLHEHLAAVNILISENGTPKIAGFGMALICDLYRWCGDKEHSNLRWLPPETLQDGIFSTKSQIWSFGGLLWEIVSLGGLPYCTLNDQMLIDYMLVNKNLKLTKPKNCGSKLYELIQEQCCQYDAKCRPDFPIILRHLHDLNVDSEVSEILVSI